MGFVNFVVPKYKVMSKAIELAEKICANAPIAISKTEELFYKGRTLEDQQAMELIWRLFAENENTEDCKEENDKSYHKGNFHYDE